ncbi:MAG: nitroreductase family protein [Candidatus Eisenbacteria bacterium]|nr:nitroreductase family protein [Candidatus Eisenbacteria bacterium]
MSGSRFVPLHFESVPEEEMRRRAQAFYQEIRLRRTVRDFSPRPVPREIIEDSIRSAGAAPSGANLQPWHFAVVADPDLKRRIREGAEEEERRFYRERAPQEWLDVLAPLGTDDRKPFLEIAPYLIVIFAQAHGVKEDGTPYKTYYAQESTGIATGFLIAALHRAGLATLTHTPSPMNFLNEILARPKHERPFLILVTGFPADQAQVPDIDRKALSEIATFH